MNYSANITDALRKIYAGHHHAGHLLGVPTSSVRESTLQDLITMGLVRIQKYGRGKKSSVRAIITLDGMSVIL